MNSAPAVATSPSSPTFAFALSRHYSQDCSKWGRDGDGPWQGHRGSLWPGAAALPPSPPRDTFGTCPSPAKPRDRVLCPPSPRRQHQGWPPLFLPPGHHHRALQVMRRWSEHISGRGEDPQVGLAPVARPPRGHRPFPDVTPPCSRGCSLRRRMPSRVPSLRMLRSFFTDGVSAGGRGWGCRWHGPRGGWQGQAQPMPAP